MLRLLCNVIEWKCSILLASHHVTLVTTHIHLYYTEKTSHCPTAERKHWKSDMTLKRRSSATHAVNYDDDDDNNQFQLQRADADFFSFFFCIFNFYFVCRVCAASINGGLMYIALNAHMIILWTFHLHCIHAVKMQRKLIHSFIYYPIDVHFFFGLMLLLQFHFNHIFLFLLKPLCLELRMERKHLNISLSLSQVPRNYGLCFGRNSFLSQWKFTESSLDNEKNYNNNNKTFKYFFFSVKTIIRRICNMLFVSPAQIKCFQAVFIGTKVCMNSMNSVNFRTASNCFAHDNHKIYVCPLNHRFIIFH